MFYGSIPALITPFKNKGSEIDFKALEKLVSWHIKEKSDALVIAGTTGEGPTYSDDEYQEVLETVLKASDELIAIIATSGTNSTKKSVERTKIAKKLGAAATLAIIPYYNKPNFTGIVKHFEEIAQVGLPVIVYHHPGRTGISLSARELATLHNIENIIAIKEASDDPSLTKEICSIYPQAQIFAGNDDLTLEVIKNGGVGGISVIANLLPNLWHELLHNPEKHEVYAQIKPVIEAINLEVNPQGIKCAMSYAGHCENILRLPMVPVSKETESQITRAIDQSGLFTQTV